MHVCKYCPKSFNRKDNWRQHLRLHTRPNTRLKRVAYNPEAVKQYTTETERLIHSRRVIRNER
ncbi:uncharacterized protein BCR38DRAFT_447524 [Pseudomassariella vexata]|uniref:C2H2-type domain-containing protein n=1 Tax=Pseudomassariella vexata TaxID=1141098 RepID=A0A1Y2DGX0_9PEZI|nr:uncharacterized protein BCR38DRAFT_447524 [Pseudomassariella vexata]ORY58513.1 hypothetical protein BCR38DRAFT_447524 [Pseudomassariella vexata]